jgi:hypothetical protein
MKIQIIISIFTFLVFSLNSCISYDKTLIYKRDYYYGKNSLLRFDGFYSDTINRKIYGGEGYYSINPIYFYSDGSVLIASTMKDTGQLKSLLANKIQFGSWGNYKIDRDSITIETLGGNAGTWRMERYFKKGVILKNRIIFNTEIDRKEKSKPINEDIYFVSFPAKPDSSLNWIRHKKKYNK